MSYTFERMVQDFPELLTRLERVEGLLFGEVCVTKLPKDMMNVTEAAEYLTLSIATVYTKASKKEIPYSKCGKRLYFSRLELSEFIRVGRQLTNEEIKQQTISHAGILMMKGCSK
ncbi:MAG: helix-turn-helix domain-containing protein [Ignavibacteria bacterium]|nr:helix-turn-helix domain-containing protein [Ignavibacteria bacterium]